MFKKLETLKYQIDINIILAHDSTVISMEITLGEINNRSGIAEYQYTRRPSNRNYSK